MSDDTITATESEHALAELLTQPLIPVYTRLLALEARIAEVEAVIGIHDSSEVES